MTPLRATLTAVAIAAIAGCATTPAGPPIVVANVHQAPGASKAEVCGRARDWAARTFKDSSKVVQVYDAERGKMIGKGNMMVPFAFATSSRVGFTFEVTCVDGSARTLLDQFEIHLDPPMTGTLPAQMTGSADLYSGIKQQAQQLDASLGAAVSH